MYDFSKGSKGLLCRRVKLNNDSSCSISIDFSKIFCIVQPNENRNQLQLTLISLKKETQGQILWIKDCTSDYLSCSLRYVHLRTVPWIGPSNKLWFSVRLGTTLPSEWKSDQRHLQARPDWSNFLKQVKKINPIQLEFFWQITINQINLWLMQLLLCLGKWIF